MFGHYGVSVSNRMKWATRVVVAPFALIVAALFLVRWIGPQWQIEQIGEESSPLSWFAGGLVVVAVCFLFRALSLVLRKRYQATADWLAAILAAATGVAVVVHLKHALILSGRPFEYGTAVGVGFSVWLLNKWGVFTKYDARSDGSKRIRPRRRGPASVPQNEPKHSDI